MRNPSLIIKLQHLDQKAIEVTTIKPIPHEGRKSPTKNVKSFTPLFDNKSAT